MVGGGLGAEFLSNLRSKATSIHSENLIPGVGNL